MVKNKFEKIQKIIGDDIIESESSTRVGGISIVCGDSLRFDNVRCLLETKQFNVNSMGVMHNV